MANNQANELSQPPYQNQLEAIFTDTNLQLVGSVGRYMIRGAYEPTSLPVRRPNGKLRDIDVLCHTADEITADIPTSALRPLNLDLTSCSWIKPEANGIWLTLPSDHSLAEAVRPEVFEPVTRRFMALSGRTYSVVTQQKINRLAGFERPKDTVAFRCYDIFVDSLLDRTDVQAADEPLPAVFYEPFYKFNRALQQKHKSYFLACHLGVMVNAMPSPVRRGLQRLGQPVKRRYLGVVPSPKITRQSTLPLQS